MVCVLLAHIHQTEMTTSCKPSEIQLPEPRSTFVVDPKKIASVFEAFENEHTLLGKRLETLKQQKKGLMQQLLTGKVRGNVDSNTTKEAV